MPSQTVYAGAAPLHQDRPHIQGEFVEIDGAPFFCIRHYDQMPPFLMSIVSAYDHWMFLSSTGGLTAGRKEADQALFPYYTDDKLHDGAEQTGSKTILLVEKAGKTYLWEPFSSRYAGAYQVARSLYKHKFGHQVMFEEENVDLGLTFSYAWKSGDRFGWVREASLRHTGTEAVQVRLLDGVQNLLPPSVGSAMQNERSNLMDAYKKSELLPESGLGLFALSAIPVDKPEPSEALRATTVWSTGLPGAGYLLCSRQVAAFRQGQEISTEVDIRAARGAYFLHTHLDLAPGDQQNWSLVIEARQDGRQVADLHHWLQTEPDPAGQLQADINRGTERLAEIIASSDGFQHTGDTLSGARHFSNVLFNVMRGGAFWKGYLLPRADFLAFLEVHNKAEAAAWGPALSGLPEEVDIHQVWTLADTPQRRRLAYEYLPLYFSRRHGDPSRPWNRFSIQTRDDAGNPLLYFEGNWRDIFQNWEALAWSFPDFTPAMIAKFVNASTADGYNPYRITREGIDWEVLDPEDPWAFIGYWGDHQIIYLLKLMEVAWEREPDTLRRMLSQAHFAFAHVPYRIHAFDALLQDPHDTIDFDEAAEAEIERRVAQTGADGKLLWDQKGSVYQVTLTEKLLITSLTKISNLILEGGIWMNTQRPEWNDANNALVGYGISVVTLAYLRRFQAFCAKLFAQGADRYPISVEVAQWFRQTLAAIEEYASRLPCTFDDTDRMAALRAWGEPASAYREQLYARGFSGETEPLGRNELLRYFRFSQQLIDHSLQANQRSDKLFHAYNLLQVSEDGMALRLRYLYEMLEGQVAALSAGLLSPAEAVEVLDALKGSALFRTDQYSYMLYPNRDLPRFTEKNRLPAKALAEIPLLQLMHKNGDHRLVGVDQQGQAYFHGNIRNGKDVAARLDALAKEPAYRAQVEASRQAILDVFEDMFDHASFTGRSGTFFGYEGLGSIYWHMVSKLLLAVGEVYYQAVEAGASRELRSQLIEHYYEIRAGIGLDKSPALYGAFPTDPYSHTPAHAGAQQPGMTGQVKEDILSRWFELGVRVKGGSVQFLPALLRESEFLDAPESFTFYNLEGEKETLTVPARGLAFTFCQVPVVYRLGEEEGIHLYLAGGREERLPRLVLGQAHSRELFTRSGEIRRIEVYLKPHLE
ncbi:MAG: hypothetical protein D6722_01925 [Bacteroidetes bacterium]|nr:MAG: hypothetical protein D6722_01925 [Bacteroidota bacterium]